MSSGPVDPEDRVDPTDPDDLATGDIDNPSRMIGLSDGVVSIAMTLLALDLQPALPSGASTAALRNDLYDHRSQFLAFVIAFAVTARYWMIHHRILRPVRRHDPALAWANMFFLFTVTLIPFSTYVVGNYGGSLGNTIFAANLLLGSIAIGLLDELIRRHGLTATPIDRDQQLYHRVRSVTAGCVPLLVAVVAWISPQNAPWFWLLFFAADLPGQVLQCRRQQRQRSRTT